MDFRFDLIKAITNDFSVDQLVGRGGFGKVYRAVHNGEDIAVKRLNPSPGFDDRHFDNELHNLTKICHQNVVQLLGYCYESRQLEVEYEGQIVFATKMERVLCFEFVEGGSLDKYIADGSCILDWPTCYNIIKGMCEGLNHLHNAQEDPIFHLDLKPAKILLDKKMTPKIAGFGLSKLLASTHTYGTVTLKGTRGYRPPEYLDRAIISKKFDVFSLGVMIIDITARNMGFSQCSEMSPSQFIELVCKNWKEKLQTLSRHSLHEIDILRVRTCLDIALRCVSADRNKRPSIQEIVLALEEQEAGIKEIMSPSPDHKSNWVGEMSGSIGFTLALIETITNNFSADQNIGSGEYADVYKALHNGEEIAVKKLHPLQTLDDKAFDNEFCNLIKVRHNNVIQLVGYCHESRKIFEHKGEPAFREKTERILCFEYMQDGSLDRYIADESCIFDWPTCYNIVKGTCKGLNHLHNSQEKPIFHLNLNTANILLDKRMTPKIASLGFSRLVASTKTEIIDYLKEAKDYMPPEFLNMGIISEKFDVFSLGVIIIKMLAGNMGFSRCAQMPPNQFIELVRKVIDVYHAHILVSKNWNAKLHTMTGHSFHDIDIDILKVRTCADIALRCVDADRNRRPSVQEIIWVLEIKTIMLLSTDDKSNWFGVDYQSRSTTVPDKSEDLSEDDIQTDPIEAEIKTTLSLFPEHKSNWSCSTSGPDSKDLTEAEIPRKKQKIEPEIKKNLVEAEDKKIFSEPPGHKFLSFGFVSQSCSTSAASDQSKDLLLQMRSEPHLSLQYLKDITNNFSGERIIGKGAFGVIYKGVLQNGEMVAVKRLLQAISGSEKQFENEVNLLMKLKHPNIVLLVGYCYDTQHLRTPHEGKFIFAWHTESLLCLEYLPKGSLDNYISDASSGLDWRTRRIIIEGISFGLQYLHEQYNDLVIHLDLKPGNILLDENMIPKISDFGLSRLFKRTIVTETTSGTRGYVPPEYVRGIITPKWDIFSLGVIIMEVITGHRNYPDDIRKSSEGFVKLELEKWRNRLQQEPGHTSQETDCQQIERCIQIGLLCVNLERTKRPTMKTIIDMLQGVESMNWYISNELSNQDTEQ